MSIPNIPGISEVARVSGSGPGRKPAATAAAPVRRGGASAPPTTSDAAAPAQPTPPRFPWLSRLSQQLESAATQKPAFPSAPVLGDNVDKSA